VLQTLPANTIDCVITSPPYWRRRDYGVQGQLGQENTCEEYVQKLVEVFDEVKRVLKPTGTCWVNLGDTYANWGMRSHGFKERRQGKKFASHNRTVSDPPRPRQPNTIWPGKSLVLASFRFAIAMVSRGWILRNIIIWHKPNALPSSAKDRFTVDFEYLFFFTKSPKYFFERQFDPHHPSTIRRVQAFRQNQERFDPARHKSGAGPGGQSPFEILERISRNGLDPRGRNKRCVWTIPVRGFRGGHFATFPEQLIEIPMKAGCPPGGVVCDPFLGSGTTALVARKLLRRFIGIELNPNYVRLARERLASCRDKQ